MTEREAPRPAPSRARLPLAPRPKPPQGASVEPGKPMGNLLDDLRKIILNLAFFALVGLLVFAAVKVLRSGDMTIDAIGLPKNIKELGYSEDGAALILSDNIRTIAEAAKADEALLTVKTNFEDQDISVPVEGLSFSSIIRLLRQTLGLPQHRLIADFVCPNEPCTTGNLELRLRYLKGTGAPKAVANVKGASPDAILQAAAERFMEQQAPMALALHLYNEEPARRAEAMALTQRIARSGSDEKLSALNLIGVELLERPEKRPEDLKQAIGYFEQVIAQEPGLAMAHTNWGAALSALGDKAGATEKYREAIRLAPDEPMQHHNLGVVLAAQGKTAEAIASFEKAISLAPGYADSYMGLGGVQMGAGDAAAALGNFEKAAALNPSSADAQYNIGVAASKTGNATESRQAFETYLQLEPDASDKVTVQGFIDELSKLQ